ncbi:MAG: hypothetical protein PWR13_923 [Archaeoglobi archaeon]|nr:TIGR04084 family radical SAM/SPASM domain-containing protein [Candidatus Mnemosynella bozhongmuii]MDI3502915.1 hypothetical protein [Archaeoglobi archaeon]MDK2781895.1 hypothetical protein [Archaeoglobi archaeon]
MLYIIILTPKCNLRCRYCGGFESSVMSERIEYDVEQLKDFLSADPHPVVAFYGGEPLLEIEMMRRMMRELEAERYVLQTNGTLLGNLEKEDLERFSAILVSFDGRESVHNFYRAGSYSRVLENVRAIRENYRGELIARMVATQKTEIYEDVIHILSLNLFTHVHWQIDAVWSNEGIWKDFRGWVKGYNEDIRRLVDFWIEEMRNGRFHGIVPFLGILSALENGFSHPPCGSGFESFAITTDGRVLACPICPEFEWNELGTIFDGELKEVELLEPCPECEYFSFCGGRCLFFNRERLWGEDGFELVCSTVRNLVDALLERKDEILSLCPAEELRYPKFPNTTEIIP